MKNYYNILGISKDASQDDIKKAYRKLSKQYHPDVNPQGEEKFREIAEAYDVLSDPQKKQMFDMGQDPNSRNPFGGSAQGFDVDEFLRSMGFAGDPFRNGGGGFRKKPTAPDKIITVEIDPLESYTSPNKDITYRREVGCNTCSGSGGEKQNCGTCNGQGFVMQRVGNGMFQQIIQSECPTCRGRGFFITKACYDCNATGTKGEMKTINIHINHGIDDGEFYRMDSAGDFHNGSYGNLLIKIKMKKNPLWEKLGDDLIYYNIVDFQGLTNETFEIPHPDGKLSIKYPLLFDTSSPLRIKGKGFKKDRVGDLYVKNVVKFTRDQIPTP
jgi:molecular chaperone DnaJ